MKLESLLHVSKKVLLYSAAAVTIFGLVYLARASGLPLPSAPPGRDDVPRQEQQYRPNGDGTKLPVTALPTPALTPTPYAAPAPTATATPEPSTTPTYAAPTPSATAAPPTATSAPLCRNI